MGIDILADSDSGINDDDLSKIEVNKEFARRFEHNKKREELHRYEELKKKGIVASSSDSEDSGDDDDDLVEPEMDLQFYDALLRVKKGDPILTQKDAKLFEEEEEEEEEEDDGGGGEEERKEKPMYLKDVNYMYLTADEPKCDGKVYNKDQEENVKAFLKADKEAFGDDDDDVNAIIKVKERSNGDNNKEVDEIGSEIHKKLDAFFGDDGNLNEDDAFLKNYLSKTMWVDKEKGKKPVVFDDIDVSEDEDVLDKQDLYEAQYNFRHEEVEGDRILGHARFIEGSVRKKTSSRKVQRKSKEERMAQAEFERKEELKRLKNLKKKEIQEKFERFRAIAGLGEDKECKLGAEDLDEDFDPEEYDKKMRETFDVDYYGAEDPDPGFASGDEGDLEKPDFDKEDELLGLPKDWDVCGSSDGFNAVRERVLKQGEDEGETGKEEGKRKKKRKITLKEKVELDKELEEYYKLDYEDTIGDLKTRFKYKSVPPNRFGLGTEEILMAEDKDLNQYVSLKKLVPYKEKEWKVTYHQKLKKDVILQGRITDAGKTVKKSRAKGNKAEDKEELSGDENAMSRRTKRRRRQAELKLSWSRLIAYGKIPPKPHKRK